MGFFTGVLIFFEVLVLAAVMSFLSSPAVIVVLLLGLFLLLAFKSVDLLFLSVVV